MTDHTALVARLRGTRSMTALHTESAAAIESLVAERDELAMKLAAREIELRAMEKMLTVAEDQANDAVAERDNLSHRVEVAENAAASIFARSERDYNSQLSLERVQRIADLTAERDALHEECERLRADLHNARLGYKDAP